MRQMAARGIAFYKENNRKSLFLRFAGLCLMTMSANTAIGQTTGATSVPGAPGAAMGAAANFNAGGGNPVFGASPPPRPFVGAPGALNFNMGSGFFGRSLSTPAAPPVYSFSGSSGVASGASGGAPRAGVIDEFNAMGDMR
jgi:hypothetical protein